MAASLTLNGVIPLYYELGCESAYPVHEGLAGSFITVINNVVGMVFFFLIQIPQLAKGIFTCSWSCALNVHCLFKRGQLRLTLALLSRNYRYEQEWKLLQRNLNF